MPTANEQLLDEAIRHAIYIERLGKGVARRIVSVLRATEGDLIEKLAGRLAATAATGSDSGPATTRRVEEILASIRTINAAVYEKVASGMRSELEGLVDHEAEFQARSIGKAVDLRASIPPAGVLRQIVEFTPVEGFLLKDWFAEMPVKRLGRIEQQLRIGMTAGETIDQMVARIRGTKAKGFKDGVLNISRNSAETLSITATSTVANKARLEVFRNNPEIVKGVQWVSTLDSRTSETCQSRDGRFYELDKPHPTPPAHFRCRSVLIPVTKSWEELGHDCADLTPQSRASMNGQVAGDTKFEGWLSRQPQSAQEEVLGLERSRLFRDGKVSFRDLYNSDDKFYTLEELRRREGL